MPATIAWKAARFANLYNDLGPWAIAVVRMIVTDPTSGKHLGIVMISAHAPTSDAFETLKSEFEDALTTTINRCTDGNVIVICADANASLGTNPTSKNGLVYTSIGSRGISYTNNAGRRLRSFLE